MLTDEQVEYFESGMLYVNVHTEAVVRSAGKWKNSRRCIKHFATATR